MNSSKTEKTETAPESKAAKKKSRLKRLIIWLFIDSVVIAGVVILLLYRPGRYDPLSTEGFKPGQVSPYLTLFHSAVYNGAQLGKPFEVSISQEGLNDIVARADWPMENNGVMLYAPAVVLQAGKAVLMGTANVRGMEFVVTIELQPLVDEQGLMNLKVEKLKVGAMNVTPLARLMAKKMYAEQVAGMPLDKDSWRTKIVASLLNEEPFEPLFPTGDKKIDVRLDKIAVENASINFRLIPIR
jgi:hypothetical protein